MARKPNKTGRDTTEHYIKIERSFLETPAWRALSFSARAIYPFIRLEWHGPLHNNNGRIQLSVRQAANKAGMGVNTAARAFQDLQAKGFLFVTEKAVLGVSGEARAPSYEITEITMPGSGQHSGRRLYANWTKGHDFPVDIHHANNPTGRNGNKTPTPKRRQERLQNGDVGKTHVPQLVIALPQKGDVQALLPVKSVTNLETSLVTTTPSPSLSPRPTPASRIGGGNFIRLNVPRSHRLPPTFQMIS